MSKLNRVLRYSMFFLLMALCVACAPSKKNTYLQKRKRASTVHTAQLGRNRFFYSTGYQKKLVKTYKNKR